MNFGSIVSPIVNQRSWDVPECWDDMELDDDRLILRLDDCKSCPGEDVRSECLSPFSTFSLPVKPDFPALDDSVWDFEVPCANRVEEEAFDMLEKSESVAYCTKVLNSFSQVDSDDEESDEYDSSAEDNQMECLPVGLVDKFGSTRRNLFSLLDEVDGFIDRPSLTNIIPEMKKQK
jgi:hypothetical protein